MNLQGIALRPVARQGKSYDQELHQVLQDIGTALFREAQSWLLTEPVARRDIVIGALALKHRLNFNETVTFLHKRNLLDAGTMRQMEQQGRRPSQSLQEGGRWLAERDLLPAELAAQLTVDPSVERPGHR